MWNNSLINLHQSILLLLGRSLFLLLFEPFLTIFAHGTDHIYDHGILKARGIIAFTAALMPLKDESKIPPFLLENLPFKRGSHHDLFTYISHLSHPQ